MAARGRGLRLGRAVAIAERNTRLLQHIEEVARPGE